MLKWVGSILIIVSCTAFGLIQSALLQKRVQVLQTAVLLTDEISNHIRYLSSTLEELVESLCRQEKYQVFSFLPELKQQMCKGVSYPQACQKAFEGWSFPGAAKEDFKTIRDLFCILGTTDTEGQLSLMADYHASFEEMAKAAQIRAKKYGSLYRTSGMLAGALVVILIL